MDDRQSSRTAILPHACSASFHQGSNSSGNSYTVHSAISPVPVARASVRICTWREKQTETNYNHRGPLPPNCMFPHKPCARRGKRESCNSGGRRRGRGDKCAAAGGRQCDAGNQSKLHDVWGRAFGRCVERTTGGYCSPQTMYLDQLMSRSLLESKKRAGAGQAQCGGQHSDCCHSGTGPAQELEHTRCTASCEQP